VSEISDEYDMNLLVNFKFFCCRGLLAHACMEGDAHTHARGGGQALTCTHTNACTHTHTRTHTRTNTHAHNTHILSHTHTLTYLHVCASIHVCTHTRTYTHITCIHIHARTKAHVHMQARTHARNKRKQAICYKVARK